MASGVCQTYSSDGLSEGKERSATAVQVQAIALQLDGGAEGNRTPDLLNAIQALSQLSYSPIRPQNVLPAPLSVKGPQRGVRALSDLHAQAQIIALVGVALRRRGPQGDQYHAQLGVGSGSE